MFYKKFNKNNKYSLTWQQTLRTREIAKNGYRAMGDIKKAKAFVRSVSNYSPQIFFEELGEKVIFSLYDIADVPLPAFS